MGMLFICLCKKKVEVEDFPADTTSANQEEDTTELPAVWKAGSFSSVLQTTSKSLRLISSVSSSLLTPSGMLPFATKFLGTS